MKESLNKDSDLSVSSGEPTVANSDSEDDHTPVWIPLKEEIDSYIEEAEEKLQGLKLKQSKRLKSVFGGVSMEQQIQEDGESISSLLNDSERKLKQILAYKP